MDKKIGVAVLGAGSRSRGLVKWLLDKSEHGVKIAAVYDPDTAVVKDTIANCWTNENPKICASAEEAIQAPGVDWVMIFSPNYMHKEHILAGFAAGKKVFSEKPLATTIADCKEIYAAQQKYGLTFATGFVLRYAPLYRKAKELLDSGKFGHLIALEANENIDPSHGGYIMCNWRRLRKFAGPHILEKCCHDLDLINWLTNSVPTKISAFGGRNFFKPENNFLMEKYGAKTFKSWWDPHATETPFSDDTDMMDNTMAVMEFRNQIRVTFTATMSNAIPERRMNFICSEGTFKLDLYEEKLYYKQLGADGVTMIDMSSGGCHGGGDQVIMSELWETMSRGTAPKCSGAEGLRSAVCALAIDQAAQTQQVVDLEPIWKDLNV